MQSIHLNHHPRLGYMSANALRHLPAELQLPLGCSNFISFRKHPSRKADTVLKGLHAAQRPLAIYGDGAFCFFGVQSDSPLAPLLLWDGAHFLHVGQTVTVMEDTPFECYLDREYFSASLKVVSRSATSVTYEKVSRLAAESNDDLDSWTFGIPVGPEDATVLNAVVKRILEIDIPDKEILLCGTPGSNFAYFDKVRIVGEDITAPPVQICKKKNRLAQEARCNNLVILHDRVFLPKHFGEMVRRFGPRYPLMTLQSMFFDNPFSMHPRRYSDYGMVMGEIAQGLLGLHRNSGKAVAFAPSIFTEVDRTGFRFANPMRYNSDFNYPTGSLYICRKEVWNSFPLDQSLYWVEFEDIEHALRASKSGIPSRVNPFGITQSITSRALLGCNACVESVSGGNALTGPRNLSMLKKKPLVRVSSEIALSKLRQFAAKYSVVSTTVTIPTGAAGMSPRAWLELINSIIHQSAFKNDIETVEEFIGDFERLILMDQMSCTSKELLVRHFMVDPVQAKQNLIIHSAEICNMLRQRASQSWFADDLSDFFHVEALSLPGILLSALRAYYSNDHIFYFESFRGAVRAIYNSTPFKSYAKGPK
ncbi:hypothetical protein KDX38_13945 [Pseudomonas sp. CDFA 602]|uniref:hypothetical protein n=1 Tax=Pseudomonas californiensis TaxID=2829823 RepID=UPI001E5A94BE|nr:hypothetical protein [Pseudomonas californiensis]MCD5994700.1 hypothetical protein [Pseudomonas californiensis]MCD6000315.1 hypothetical protein [Pseudomonas californiensis]